MCSGAHSLAPGKARDLLEGANRRRDVSTLKQNQIQMTALAQWWEK